MVPFKIDFILDGTGVYFDRQEPPHLDSLLAWTRSGNHKYIERDDCPDEIKVPLMESRVGGHLVRHGSALFIEKHFETMRFWRKKIRRNRLQYTTGSPNATMGIYREYNMPVQLVLTRNVSCYGFGDIGDVKCLLFNNIKALGKKRSQGYGRIVNIDIHEIDDDKSLVYDGLAMRWLPDDDGSRLVRCKPPYWNNTDKVMCCEVFDMYDKNRIESHECN